MDTAPVTAAMDIVEVEEAELSSDDDAASAKPNDKASSGDDFVLHDEDDEDDDIDDAPSNPHGDAGHMESTPAPAGNNSNLTDRKRPASQNSSFQSDSNPGSPQLSAGHRDDRPKSTRNADDSYSSHHDKTEYDEDDDDDDNINLSDAGEDGNLSNKEEESKNINGVANHSESEAASSEIHPRRSRGYKTKLVIPSEMRDNEEYFRRSKRERRSPERLSITRSDSSSSSAGSDSDFNAIDGDGVEEVYEEEYEDDDDEDFSPGFRRKSRGPRRQRTTSAPRRRQSRAKQSDDLEPVLDDPHSQSDSDDDWCMKGRTKPTARRRRRSTNNSDERRPSSRLEGDEIARAARVNSRTGGTVNYFEGDDDFLDSDDEAALKEAAEEREAADDLPYVDLVFDYRLIEGRQPRIKSDVPFADFHSDDVEFHIKWSKKSFRTCTWETWENLKPLKGAKRVSNYIKQVEMRRDYLQSSNAVPEDIEESRIQIAEHRASFQIYETVERIVTQREESESENGQTQFLVKWANLPYSECTWELRSDLSSDADIKAIDNFIDREQSALSMSGKKSYNPFNVKDDRPRFKRMMEQPEFLHGEGRKLRDYQLAGVNFLSFSWTKRNNVILADEMGLGKTVQTIAFLGWLLYARHVAGPFLVVVPLSTIAAWVREFNRWVPDMNVLCYSGNGKSRSIIRQYEFFSSTKRSVEKFHVLLTTPELLMQDQEYLSQFRYAVIAVDEAHRLKNETSSLHTTLASIRSANRLLVTGTPLQNSVRELWALLHFLNPSPFPNAEDFEASFSFTAMRDPERVSALHSTLRPYMVRRQKNEVEKSLPRKTYSVVRVRLTSAQQQYYRWLLTKNVAKLNATGKARGVGTTASIRNLLMELKKCCNHLFLFPDYEDTSTRTTVQDLIRASGKMRLLDMMLLRLREKGHRVLIFSQMVRMLDILQDYCRMRNFPFQRLDGNVANEARQRAVDHFNAPDSLDYVFLLSTRAGGLGINLATADTVIIFDSDWNPQNDLQAESRAHRIGQTKDVKVIRMLCRETVEEDILERAKRKRVLEHLIIHGVEGGTKADGKEGENAFKKEELSAILRFGAEKLFAKDKLTEPENGEPTDQDAAAEEKDEKGEERKGLEMDDIDALLERGPSEDAVDIGADQPSIGASLLNAFKWNDFDLDEDEDDDKDSKEDSDTQKKRAIEAASRMVVRDKEVVKAQETESREKDKHAGEGDVEFWDRVIPEEIREEAIANDVILGTRRRKRTNSFAAGSPKQEKRRRMTRAVRDVDGKVSDVEELTDKEQRSLFRSFKKFGDPKMTSSILSDAGLQHRVEEDFCRVIFEDCLEKAQVAADSALAERTLSRKKNAEWENGREGDSEDETRVNGKETKRKRARVTFEFLGDQTIDAQDLLKRCRDLEMLRKHLEGYDVDTQFRLRSVGIKSPSYAVKWRPQHDAMLLVGICRHGFGNWGAIAADSQLGLTDKMHVAGNSQSKPGAPDTTKLTRRAIMLLRELENETQSRKNTRKSGEKSSKKSSKKSSHKHGSMKVHKAIKKKSGSQSGSSKAKRKSKGRGEVDKKEKEYHNLRLQLRRSDLLTLKELRALSKEDNDMDTKTKIKKTKQCLLKLGREIQKLASQSVSARDNLWKYVHDVCRTSLEGHRLQQIHEKLASAIDAGDQ